eukprot:3136950-Pyramimonas_sp.AAC.1
MKGCCGFQWSAYQKDCSGMPQECEGATITLVRGVEVPRMVVWQSSRSFGHSNEVDPWRSP